jgi:hypothetical protein
VTHPIKNPLFIVHRVERALALGYAALEQPSSSEATVRATVARERAADVLLLLGAAHPPGVARGETERLPRLIDLAAQLRAVVVLLDRKLGRAALARN